VVRAQLVRSMSDIARHVRARGARLLSTRTTPASVGTTIFALRDVIIIDVDMIVVGRGRGLLERRGERRGSRSSSRSSRHAAAPSPPVRGPAACSRRPPAAAVWRCVVAASMMSRLRAFVREERCSRVHSSVSTSSAADVSVPFERVGIGVETVGRSRVGGGGVPPILASETRGFICY
jgi:hypothetical protein